MSPRRRMPEVPPNAVVPGATVPVSLSAAVVDSFAVPQVISRKRHSPRTVPVTPEPPPAREPAEAGVTHCSTSEPTALSLRRVQPDRPVWAEPASRTMSTLADALARADQLTARETAIAGAVVARAMTRSTPKPAPALSVGGISSGWVGGQPS